MADEDDLHIRPGRIRSSKAQRARPFVSQALAAARRAGGHVTRSGRLQTASSSRFGKGRVASIRANRFMTSRTRSAVIKARIVRHRKSKSGKSRLLTMHLDYLKRDGVGREESEGRLFDARQEEVSGDAFAARCEDDRHHFRFIVSPEDAHDMADLKGFTCELMSQMETDLGTRLDWVAVDHWNTEHPHIHIILRGRNDDGTDLVISRDYIGEGFRAQARNLITQELGPCTELEMTRAVDRQVTADRWTQLDRQLVADSGGGPLVDLIAIAGRGRDEFLSQKIGRLRHLQRLGLAEQVAPGKWMLATDLQPSLRELGARNEIIKRLHKTLGEQGIERGASEFVLAGESLRSPIIGRLVARGFDDELAGTAFVVVDGIDGRSHHVRLADIDSAGDSRPGSIVELRRFEDRQGRQRAMIATRCDLPIEAQVSADGATWLDRQLVARDPHPLSRTGFGRDVQDALKARGNWLVDQGLAERSADRLLVQKNLLSNLLQRELDAVGSRLAAETGLTHLKAGTRSADVAGVYTRRLDLASGRFAVIEGPGPTGGLGFRLVPWSVSLERFRQSHVLGTMRENGTIAWRMARQRGLGL